MRGSSLIIIPEGISNLSHPSPNEEGLRVRPSSVVQASPPNPLSTWRWGIVLISLKFNSEMRIESSPERGGQIGDSQSGGASLSL